MKKQRIYGAAMALALCAAGMAQPPMLPPPELDRMVNRIALYPDPLLAQVLAAATFPDDIPEAANWADRHHYLAGDSLAAAISGDHLPWDPSVQALLPFPGVLDMMARDMGWTRRMGDAFLAQQQDVMDAVQRDRRLARDYGYLRSNRTIVVSTGPYIEIAPVNPGWVYVPVYDPLVVFAPPRPGFFVAGAINFGFGFAIGPAFRPWGWGYNRFAWSSHTVVVNNVTWNRTYVTRNTYVHPYTAVQRYEPAGRVETHQLVERNDREREAYRTGHVVKEEHRGRR
jgi:hypothetical protein